MTDEEKRSLALAAGHAAVSAATELLRYAREGADWPEPFGHEEPIEKLCDAAKMAIELAIESAASDDERNQVHAALCSYLDGWVG